MQRVLSGLSGLVLAGLLTHAAQAAPAAPAPDSLPPRPVAAPLLSPLILDQDYGLGTTVVFDRIPSAQQLSDLAYVSNLRHVIVSLAAWPANYDALQPFGQVALPDGADYIVVLRDYPPTREQADMWNYLRVRLRLILVVGGPPTDRGQILQLNAIRSLERVIAEMDSPTRSGFERLQRPLSFRIVMP